MFKFVARNPPTIAMLGGVLMWLVCASLEASGSDGSILIGPAPWVFAAGVALQILWLFLRGPQS
ncbi:MAG: hypothetical protein ACE5IJ_05715 [Thermoplasmata archaeon]